MAMTATTDDATIAPMIPGDIPDLELDTVPEPLELGDEALDGEPVVAGVPELELGARVELRDDLVESPGAPVFDDWDEVSVPERCSEIQEEASEGIEGTGGGVKSESRAEITGERF